MSAEERTLFELTFEHILKIQAEVHLFYVELCPDEPKTVPR